MIKTAAWRWNENKFGCDNWRYDESGPNAHRVCEELVLRADVDRQYKMQREPVMYQSRRLLGNPAVVKPFWTDWAECAKAEFDSGGDHQTQVRALGVIEGPQ